MSYYILTVQSLNNGSFRFGLSQSDFNKIIPGLQEQDVFINLPGINQNIMVTSETFFNHGNLRAVEISDWIINNNYNLWENGQPFKLIFKLLGNTFYYYDYQAH